MQSYPTIAAIATPAAAGGIGIVRISGENSLRIAAQIFKPVKKDVNLTESKGYRAYFGKVYDNNDLIDEAICLVFRAGHSYTGEDTAEISCHGGMFVTQQVLRAALGAGAVPAEAGEFTKRAFLNGRIDLAESEAVMSLIGASGKQAASAALNTLDGLLSREISEIAQSIVSVCAGLAAWVDYPDEDIADTSDETLLPVFENAKKRLEDIIRRFDCGKVLTQGIDTVIVGKPNVGKSTLMNMLSGCERSIVTDIAGTTRDVVEESVKIGELILHLADTAGIHQTDNVIENIGVDRARQRFERAALVLAVFDSAKPLSDDDMEILRGCKGKLTVAVVNKADLPTEADINIIERYVDETVRISAATGEGTEDLEAAVSRLLSTDLFDPSSACLANERQRACCVRAIAALDEAIAALFAGVTLDAVTVCAEGAVDALLELTGQKAKAAIVDEVFSRFCVGK